MERARDGKADTIRLPVNIVRKQRRIARAVSQFIAAHDHAPSDDEIATLAEMTVDEVRAVRDVARAVASLDRRLGDGGDDVRYGLAGTEPAPLREIGERLGLTPERVRQIESAALVKLGRAAPLAALRSAA